MPSCVLRVSGTEASIREFLSTSTLQPVRVFRKGDPGVPKSRGPVAVSGFNIVLSDAEGIAAQATEAAGFIRANREDLLRARRLGLSPATIDFGLHDRATDAHPWPSYRLPAEIVELAGEIGCDIVLSFHGTPSDSAEDA